MVLLVDTPFFRIQTVFILRTWHVFMAQNVSVALTGVFCGAGVVPAYHGHGSRPSPHLREYAHGGRVCPGEDSRLQVLRPLLAPPGTS